MDTNRLASFVATADAGSLSLASRRLGHQISTVSRHLSELERELGGKLFVRTGRGVRLTPPGERFLERSRVVLKELELARAETRSEALVKEPSHLRLSAPPDFVHQLLPRVLANLRLRHPVLSIEALGETRRVAVVEESYDAVIRLGAPGASELIGKQVGFATLGAWAPPGVSGLETARDLAAAELVLVQGTPRELKIVEKQRSARLVCEGRVRFSSFFAAAEYAAQVGLPVLLPDFAALSFARAGRLVPVARGAQFPSVPLHLLRAPRHRGSTVLSELAEELKEALAALVAELAQLTRP